MIVDTASWLVFTSTMMMTMMVLVIVMIMQMMIVVDGKQSWLKQPGYAEVNPGESVVLDCHIANKEGDCR